MSSTGSLLSYVPLTGEELRDVVLKRIAEQAKQILLNDHRFRKSVCYHKVTWTCPLTLQGWGRPEEKITLSGEIKIPDAVAQIAQLKRELEEKDRTWKELVERERIELAIAQKNLAEAQAELRYRNENPPSALTEMIEFTPGAVAASPEHQSEGSVLLASATVIDTQPPIDNPSIVREELEAKEETIGRNPEQANFDHKLFEAPKEAGRSASIPGGGVRPKNVHGKPV